MLHIVSLSSTAFSGAMPAPIVQQRAAAAQMGFGKAELTGAPLDKESCASPQLLPCTMCCRLRGRGPARIGDAQ